MSLQRKLQGATPHTWSKSIQFTPASLHTPLFLEVSCRAGGFPYHSCSLMNQSCGRESHLAIVIGGTKDASSASLQCKILFIVSTFYAKNTYYFIHGSGRGRLPKASLFFLPRFTSVKHSVMMDDNTAGLGNFDYGRAVEAECTNCGVVQIPSRGFENISCPICNGNLSMNSNNSHHSQVIRSSDHREGYHPPQDDTEVMNLDSQAGIPPNDPSMQSITNSLQQLLTENTNSGLPLQEGVGESLSIGCPQSLGRVQGLWSKLSKTPTEGHDENGEHEICRTCGTYTEHCSHLAQKPSSILYQNIVFLIN